MIHHTSRNRELLDLEWNGSDHIRRRSPYEVSNEGAVEVGDLLHASRDVGGSRGTTGVTIGLFFVVVITKDKAQQESGHHNVSNAQHREVTASGAREDQLSRQRQARNITPNIGPQVEFPGKNIKGIVSRLRGHLHHNVAVEDVGRKKHLPSGKSLLSDGAGSNLISALALFVLKSRVSEYCNIKLF